MTPPTPRDAGLPAPGEMGVGSGAERPARKPLAWDRTKFLLLFTLLFWFFVWSEYSDPNPFNTFGDAVAQTVEQAAACSCWPASSWSASCTTWSPSTGPATTGSGPRACSGASSAAGAA